MPDPPWTFFYWRRGDRPDTIRELELTPDARVSRIAEHVATNLSLAPEDCRVYKVPDKTPIPIDYPEDTLGGLSISSLGRRLVERHQLNQIFTTCPPESQLHLIVDPLTLPIRIRTWMRGSGSLNFIDVMCSAVGSLGQLKQAIKLEIPSLKDVDPTDIELFRVPSKSEELHARLGETGSGQPLLGNEILGTIFADVPFATNPFVIVDLRSEKTSKQPPPSSQHRVGDGDPGMIQNERRRYLNRVPQQPPSSFAILASFRTQQGGPQFMPCGRPHNDGRYCNDTVPCTLLHPVFGQFVDDCKTIRTTANDHSLAAELAQAMSKLFEAEAGRRDAFTEILQRFNFNFVVDFALPNTRYKLDACISVGNHACVIAEFKNEATSGHAEAYFQAIAYYLESTRPVAVQYYASPLPCLILAIFGPCIVFAGAIWNLRPTVQILSSPIIFHFHRTDMDNLLMVARHMAAFRKAISLLKHYYRALKDPVTPTLKRLFPYKTSYQSLTSSAVIGFQYEEEVAKDKLIFFGTDDKGQRICIKFSQRYSVEVHRHLADSGHAPVLRGFEQLAGGWFMSVFDALGGYRPLSDYHRLLPSSTFDSLSAILARLHSGGFVHGDFRDTNIMVSDDQNKPMIIDFDWAGRKGEARYPPCVNTRDIVRPDHDLDHKQILEEHDRFMLNNLRERFE